MYVSALTYEARGAACPCVVIVLWRRGAESNYNVHSRRSDRARRSAAENCKLQIEVCVITAKTGTRHYRRIVRRSLCCASIPFCYTAVHYYYYYCDVISHMSSATTKPSECDVRCYQRGSLTCEAILNGPAAIDEHMANGTRSSTTLRRTRMGISIFNNWRQRRAATSKT